MARKKTPKTETPAASDARARPLRDDDPTPAEPMLTQAEMAEVIASAPGQIAPVPSVVLPLGKRGDKGFVWELDPLWTERVERMAQVAGLTAQSYLDSLLRRAWVGLDQRHRGRL